jgi:hypothetical protein
MENKRYKPLLDKLFYIIWIPTSIIMIILTILSCINPISLIITLLVDLFTFYFLISSISGYVELRKDTIFIKFGFILKREIFYDKIREINKERKAVCYSMLSLKNSFEHVNIKYNKFDMITISVKNNDELIEKLQKHIKKAE